MKKNSEFDFYVNHRIGGKLTIIKEAVAIIRSEAVGVLTKKQKHFLDMAQVNISKLNNLISNNFKFQKLVSGHIKLSLQKEDINQVIRDLVSLEKQSMNQKGLKLILDLSETVPNIFFDKYLIKDALLNIVSNAITYTNKGSITIKTVLDKKNVIVIVEDTGSGIKKEDIPFIFDHIEQFKRTNKICLGLAISKEIITRHKGKIWVESTLGKGTTVWIAIPVSG
ncbi:MAG: HAMP domain-containing sensor histidine kinase [Candidatus Omnitrophota bacterium]|nr:HAMP domain-containing histidine kinase [Candidatus Omnitrophota bacterium]MBU1894455.1 HAMP domain-containing histidine kinase [Candidatus Omnitrophota bacterium]